jgi:hypothetical protein
MSPEANKSSQESLTHAQSVQSWAGKLRDSSFTPTLEEFDALGLAARHIQIGGDSDKTTYTDIDGVLIKSPVAEVVLKAADEAYWEDTHEEQAISVAVTAAAGPVGLKKDNPRAFAALETYCIRAGRPVDASALGSFAETKQKRLTLQADLRDRAASIEAGADLDRDRLVRSLSHLVTRVVAGDPAKPSRNLRAEVDTINHDTGKTKAVVLSDQELERIKSVTPEIEAGIKLLEKTPAEIADENWLAKYGAEVIRLRRNTYILNGRTTPNKGWKKGDDIEKEQAKRAAWFDSYRVTLEQKLGLKPLPDNQVMPPTTILTTAPATAYYGAPKIPPTKGGILGFVPALVTEKGKNTWAVVDVVGTGLIGPVLGGIGYATRIQAHADKARADAQDAKIEALGITLKATKDAQKQRAENIASEMEDAQKLEKIVREIAQRRAGQDVKRALSVKALSHILNGRDPARELSNELRSYRLNMSDLLPGLDVDGDKHKKDKFKR